MKSLPKKDRLFLRDFLSR